MGREVSVLKSLVLITTMFSYSYYRSRMDSRWHQQTVDHEYWQKDSVLDSFAARRESDL